MLLPDHGHPEIKSFGFKLTYHPDFEKCRAAFAACDPTGDIKPIMPLNAARF
jgi:hypothetical protein